ncbi:AAA-domain-containing protein [Wallemia mellicola]|uniref:Peroxisomal ATPase PEX1 n=1 Tax=Wallemia mellicola TaxID=1708541 RepID=A0A4T0TVX2_9BASI|nr:AAA-domain-containing protein [Wallemia mellicola]
MASAIATLAIEDYLEIDPLVANAYGLNEGSNVTISLHSSLPTAKTVSVVPDTADDWELLEAHAEYVEENLLSQVRMTSTTQPMVVYLPSSSFLTFRVEATDPVTSSSYNGTPAVRLDRDTEVAFAPKLRRPPSSSQSTVRPTQTPLEQDDSSVQQLVRLLPARVFPSTEAGVCYVSSSFLQKIGIGRKTTFQLTRIKSPITRHNEIKEKGKADDNGLSLGGMSNSLKNATSKPYDETDQSLVLSVVPDDDILDGHIAIPLGSHQRLQWKEYELLSIQISQSQVQYHEYDILKPLFNTSDDKILPGQADLLQNASEFLISSLGMSLSKLGTSRPTDRSLGLLISGGFSSGKTSLVKSLAHHLGQDSRILANSVYEDVSGWSQEKVSTISDKLCLLIEEANLKAPSLIILDNLDILLATEDEQNNNQSSRARTLSEIFVRLFSPGSCNLPQGVVLVGVASNSLHASIGASHVFGREVKVGSPNKHIRKEILEMILESYTSVDSSDVNTALVASETEGYLPTDLVSIVERALHHASLAHKHSEEILAMRTSHLERSLEGYRPHALRNVSLQSSSVGWKDIGGMRYVKGVIRETLEWPTKYAAIFKNCPLRLRSGLLLYGFPGCGKTLIASAVAKECNLNFISVKGPELLNKYIGQSEASTRHYFERAQAAKPCVLFFDEFESIAPRRGHDSTGVTDRVVNQFLTQMDGAEGLDGVYVLAATSRPDLIDPALLRPGRLDKSLLCDMPDTIDRLDILKTLTKDMDVDSDVDLQEIASKCVDYTGADLQALVYNAHLESVHAAIATDEKTVGSEEESQTPPREWSISSKNPMTRSEEAELVRRVEKLFSSTKKHAKETSKGEKRQENTSRARITAENIHKSLKNTPPSVSQDELRRLDKVYHSFTSGRPSDYKGDYTLSNEKGQTEWSQNGRHTGTSDIPLTERGAQIVKELGPRVVGEGKLIDPSQISKVFLSPRQRAKSTYELLFGEHKVTGEVVETNDAREWTYGDYEGLKPAEIKALNPNFWIWTDGCPNGESPEELTARADNLVKEIREVHRKHLEDRKNGVETQGSGDVVLVSHGHFSRVFIPRFLGFELQTLGPKLVVEAGAVQVLGYQHKNLDEPSIYAMNLE